MAKNIEINVKNTSNTYDVLYPRTTGNNIQMSSGNNLEQDINNIYTDDTFEVGDILCTCKSNISDKWLECDGGTVSRSQYPDLNPFLTDSDNNRNLNNISNYPVTGTSGQFNSIMTTLEFRGEKYYIAYGCGNSNTLYYGYTKDITQGIDTWINLPSNSFKQNTVFYTVADEIIVCNACYSYSIDGPWNLICSNLMAGQPITGLVKTTDGYLLSWNNGLYYIPQLGGSYTYKEIQLDVTIYDLQICEYDLNNCAIFYYTTGPIGYYVGILNTSTYQVSQIKKITTISDSNISLKNKYKYNLNNATNYILFYSVNGSYVQETHYAIYTILNTSSTSINSRKIADNGGEIPASFSFLINEHPYYYLYAKLVDDMYVFDVNHFGTYNLLRENITDGATYSEELQCLVSYHGNIGFNVYDLKNLPNLSSRSTGDTKEKYYIKAIL